MATQSDAQRTPCQHPRQVLGQDRPAKGLPVDLTAVRLERPPQSVLGDHPTNCQSPVESRGVDGLRADPEDPVGAREPLDGVANHMRVWPCERMYKVERLLHHGASPRQGTVIDRAEPVVGDEVVLKTDASLPRKFREAACLSHLAEWGEAEFGKDDKPDRGTAASQQRRNGALRQVGRRLHLPAQLSILDREPIGLYVLGAVGPTPADPQGAKALHELDQLGERALEASRVGLRGGIPWRDRLEVGGKAAIHGRERQGHEGLNGDPTAFVASVASGLVA